MENLQLVLTGGNGTATDISVHLCESGDSFLVFLGVALLERVPRDRGHLLYKLFVARLVNSGIGIRKLERAFGHDHKTLRTWGQASKSSDPERLLQAFAGRGAHGKVTADIRAYVEGLYLGMKGHYYDYRKRIRAAVRRRYGVHLSPQRLSQLFAQVTQEGPAGDSEAAGTAPANYDSTATDHTAAETAAVEPCRTGGVGSVHCCCDHTSDQATAADAGDECSARGSVEAVNQSPTVDRKLSPSTPDSCSFTLQDAPPAPLYRHRQRRPKTALDGACPEDLRLNPTMGSTKAVNHSPTPVASGPKQRANGEGAAGVPALQGHAGEVPRGLPISRAVLTHTPQMVRHAGQVLFSPWLDAAGFDRPAELGMQEQWLGQLLQGAVNIEQSKTLCPDSLSLFVGPVRANRKTQRNELYAQADPEQAFAALARNARLVREGPGVGTVFYYDPHVKEYTGCEPVLKGWCGRRHGVVKALNMDFIHTRVGDPCFVFHADNYYDLRERFFIVLHRFDQLFPAALRRGRTWVIDRGIFGLDTFHAFLAHGDYLITWQKDYRGAAWRDDLPAREFSRIRERNQSGDILRWQFCCQEGPWHRDPAIRRIVVRVTNPNGLETEVAILCTHPSMSIEQAVTLIFNRWIQENDFWYLDTYFGISQLTAYGSERYADIAWQLRDRPVECPEYRQLKKQHKSLETRLGKAFVAQDRNQQRVAQAEAEVDTLPDQAEELCRRAQTALDAVEDAEDPHTTMDNIQSLINQAEQISRTIRKIRRRLCGMQDNADKANTQITELKSACATLRRTMDGLLKEESRLKLLVDHHYTRLNTRCKAVMDALRLTARNAFIRLLELFRPMYDNYRDDHVMLRLLTRAPAMVWQDSDHTVHVNLWLPEKLPRRVLRAYRRLLTEMTNFINGHFAGRAAPVRIRLLDGPAVPPIFPPGVGVQVDTPPRLE